MGGSSIEGGLDSCITERSVEDSVSHVAIVSTGGIDGDRPESSAGGEVAAGNRVRKELPQLLSVIGRFTNRNNQIALIPSIGPGDNFNGRRSGNTYRRNRWRNAEATE